ncbi:hypothetical protein EVAR_76919_1 [Eumeta japonica]|uniref:Uncharacterized protein n=1 Tax=Eumeta variegata TaxID=151549 RepID=A0A4C1SEP8_EUMVA|nr:hypothetical protein EVAR_76919_1 [Eumeta japonica]
MLEIALIKVRIKIGTGIESWIRIGSTQIETELRIESDSSRHREQDRDRSRERDSDREHDLLSRESSTTAYYVITQVVCFISHEESARSFLIGNDKILPHSVGVDWRRAATSRGAVPALGTAQGARVL